MALTFPNTDPAARAAHEPFLHSLHALRDEAQAARASAAAAAAASSSHSAILQLFAAASDLTQLPHPICPRCAADVSQKVQQRIASLTEEHTSLHALARQLTARAAQAEAEAEKDEERARKAREELAKLDAEELAREKGASAAVGTAGSAAAASGVTPLPPAPIPALPAVEAAVSAAEATVAAAAAATAADKAALAAEAAALAQELRALAQAEEVVLRGHQAVQVLAADFGEALYSALGENERLVLAINELAATDPLSDLFPISVSGHVGSIAGLRLGTVPTVPVEWAEINQALGQLALLVESLRRSTSTPLPGGTKIIVKGAQSGIVRGGDEAPLPLWRADSGLAAALFRSGGFADGLVALLRCLDALCRRATDADSSLGALSYPIDCNAGTIGGVTVRYGGPQSDVEWSRAMKYVLVNCQVVLTWASAIND